MVEKNATVLLEKFLLELNDEQRAVFYKYRDRLEECDEQMEEILVVKQWNLYEVWRDAHLDELNNSSANEEDMSTYNYNSDVEENSYEKSQVDQDIESQTVDYTSRKKDIKERLSCSTSILLLGESGVGKTTFINVFANFLKDNSFPEAKKTDTEIVIPMEISYADKERDTHMIQMETSLNQPCATPMYPEITEHILTFTAKNKVTFYDTVGFGEAEEESIGEAGGNTGYEDALEFAQTKNIDIILVFLHPERSRLTEMLRIFLSKTMGSCDVEKIFFIFTHSQVTSLRFGNTYSILMHFIKKENIAIEGLDQRSFCFENNHLKFLWLLKNRDIHFDKSQERELERNWNHSMEQTLKLLERICEVKRKEEHNSVEYTLSERDTTKIIEQNHQEKPSPVPPISNLCVNAEANVLNYENPESSNKNISAVPISRKTRAAPPRPALPAYNSNDGNVQGYSNTGFTHLLPPNQEETIVPPRQERFVQEQPEIQELQSAPLDEEETASNTRKRDDSNKKRSGPRRAIEGVIFAISVAFCFRGCWPQRVFR